MSFTFPTVASVALVASLGVASAQTTQEHDAHHPETSMTPTVPVMPPASPGGMDMGMGKMAGDNTDQMMPMMRMMRSMGGGGEMRMMPSEHVEGRIAFLKAELGITEAQLPQWNEFADALRNNAKAMRVAMGTMQDARSASMPMRLDAMTGVMAARLEALKATAAAGKALYAVLSDAQKKSADELVMSPMGVM